MPLTGRFPTRRRPTRSAHRSPLRLTRERRCRSGQEQAHAHPTLEPADDAPIAGGKMPARCTPARRAVLPAVGGAVLPDHSARRRTAPAPRRPQHAATVRVANARRVAASIPGCPRMRPQTAMSSRFSCLRRLTIHGPCVTAASPRSPTLSNPNARDVRHATQTAGVLRRTSRDVAARFPIAGRRHERHVNSSALSMILRIEVTY